VLVTARGALHRLERPVHDKLPTESLPLPPGEDLIFDCQPCRNANHPGQYRLTWERLTDTLVAEQADTRSERRTITLP